MGRLPGGNGGGTERRRILIVDDCKDGADSLGLILGRWGFDIKMAYDAPSALRILGEFTPDVVFLDLVMPEMHGSELARRIRAHPAGRTTRLIALSGWPHDRDCACQRDADIEAHLVKPVNIEEIMRVLDIG